MQCVELFLVKIIWKPLSLKMSTTLRVRSSGSAFSEFIREQRDAEAEKTATPTLICNVICRFLLFDCGM